MENLDHIHEVVDQQLPFVIDPITKQIVEQSENLTVPQHAKNSERLTFSIPDRYIEGHDMSEVNQVLIHYRNIDQKTGALSAGIYKVEDLALDDDSVTLSWLLGDESTYYAGGLIFSIHFACITENGKLAYNLPTLTYSKISVGETVWNSEDVAKKYPDIIAELEGRVSALEAGKAGDAVLYTKQTLTPEQKAQARKNIGASAAPEPTAYLYNGLSLPVLPQWNKALYPYCCISTYDVEIVNIHRAVLYVSAYPFYLNEAGKCVTNYYTGLRTSDIPIKGTYWVEFEEKDWDADSSIHIPIWSNHDILNPDGTVFLAASDPVPVYEDGSTGGATGSPNAVLYTEQTLTPEQQSQARENIGIVGQGLPLRTMSTQLGGESGPMSPEDIAVLKEMCEKRTPFIGSFEGGSVCVIVNTAVDDGMYIGWFIVAIGTSQASVTLQVIDNEGSEVGLYAIAMLGSSGLEQAAADMEAILNAEY